MSILAAVVDAGSLSSGARALRMPLATVSRKVTDLESALGAELVLRSARGLTLTDTGTAYLEAARRILEDVAEAEVDLPSRPLAGAGVLCALSLVVAAAIWQADRPREDRDPAAARPPNLEPPPAARAVPCEHSAA